MVSGDWAISRGSQDNKSTTRALRPNHQMSLETIPRVRDLGDQATTNAEPSESSDQRIAENSNRSGSGLVNGLHVSS